VAKAFRRVGAPCYLQFRLIRSEFAVIEPLPVSVSLPPASTRQKSGDIRDVTAGGERDQASPLAILLVGGHALIRAALRNLLRGPALSIVAEAADATAAVPIARKLRPDVVLFDGPPADEAARAGVEAVRCVIPDSCLVCLGGADEVDLAAVCCLPPHAGLDDLHEAIAAAVGVGCGRCVLRPRCSAAANAAALSRRERQVAVCIADGLPSKQIAAVLGIGLRTVNTYRESIARKLGASSAAVVTRYVLEQGIQAG
jgi:DNA-binding NarL/FixJ family response regulator